MKNKYCQYVLSLLIFLFPLVLSAQDISTPAQFYLIHSGGCHLARNSAGRAVLEAPTATQPQMMTISPVGNGYYTVSAPGNNGYLSLQGRYEAFFLDDATSANAQYAIESAGGVFKKLKCRANGKYLGTDGMVDGNYVFSDKSGDASLSHWFLATDPAAEPPVAEVSYIINPAAERQTFDGWGVSLCWWANMCGKWGDDKIDEIVDWLVSPDGLNFRIFRYNIGGGDDPANQHCTAHHMGNGKGLRAEMEGFKDSSDGPYIWSRDAAQRKIMLKIKEKRPDAVFEAFSNSAPYYMTYSGCVAGNTDAGKDNLRPEYYEEFAHYLVDVCKHYKDEYGIEFKTLDPFNEPMTSYWGANGGQEGCHFDVSSQINMIKTLYPILKESGLKTVISVADETSVAQAVNDFIEYRKAGILDMIGQVNTHTYTADDKSRTRLSALCREENKPLWMSEVGMGGSGMAGNLALAQKLIDDMRHIMPSAWIDWQYIEENNDQWCLVRSSGFASQTYEKVKNYSIRSHFSRFIKEGYTILTTLDSHTLAARNPSATELVLVSLNSGASPLRHNVDLSMYANVGSDIKAYVTTPADDLAPFTDFTLDGTTLSFRLPASGIVTLVIPVSSNATPGQALAPGKKYLVCPRMGADLALDANGGSVKIKKINFDKTQIWTLARSGTGFTFTNDNGEILTEESPDYALKTKTAPSAGQTFLTYSLDGIFYRIANGTDTKALDLEGEKCVDNTGVGVWTYNTTDAPTHRQWYFVELPEGYGLDGVGAPVADAGAQAPIRVTMPGDGVVKVEKLVDEPGSLRVFTTSGACIYDRPVGGIVSIPLAPGCYVVSYSASTTFATTVLVR